MSEITPKGRTYAEYPFLFDWHRNQAQETLQMLHGHEAAHRAELVKIVHELKASPKFSELYSRFTDALFVAKLKGDNAAEHQTMLAMFARLYVAGSLRRTPVFEDVDLEVQP